MPTDPSRPTSPSWWGWPCANSSCVDVKRHDGGVTLTSTIDGNDGTVTYTFDEWNTFVGNVKAGLWDHTTG